MRKARIKLEDGSGYYHTMSRVIEGRMALGVERNSGDVPCNILVGKVF